MVASSPITIPSRAAWTWLTAAVVAGIALAGKYGFREPTIAPDKLRVAFVAALVLFVLSRLLLLTGPGGFVGQLKRWWVDFLLLIAALIWWRIEPPRGPIILQLAAIYCLVLGAISAGAGGVHLLSEGRRWSMGSGALRFLCLSVIIALVGGAVLALPICREGPYPVEPTHPLARYHMIVYGLNCLFTSTAALTGTGLSVLDVGYEFSATGRMVILVLMQLGGMAVLAVAAAVGWRLRIWVGWHGPNDRDEPGQVRRVILLSWVLMILFEAAGAVALQSLWPIDQRPTSFGEGRQGWFFAVFHAVSAFCNVGLVWPREGLTAYGFQPAVLGVLMPLMVLGSLGGPVLYDLCRRVLGAPRLAVETRVTLAGTILLIIIGAVSLTAIETTRHHQLRYPREQTPGRLLLTDSAPATLPDSQPVATQLAAATGSAPTTTQSAEMIVFSSRGSERAMDKQLRHMPDDKQWLAAMYQSVAARSGGVRTVRLDEHSLSPAGRAILMAEMLIGGGIGGTARGLTLMIVVLLLAAAFRPAGSAEIAPNNALLRARMSGIALAGGAAMMLMAVIGLVAIVLIYRETASVEACWFEAVSACCNSGLSMGITSQLSLEGKATLIVGMLLGRVLPLCVLMRAFKKSDS